MLCKRVENAGEKKWDEPNVDAVLAVNCRIAIVKSSSVVRLVLVFIFVVVIEEFHIIVLITAHVG